MPSENKRSLFQIRTSILHTELALSSDLCLFTVVLPVHLLFFPEHLALMVRTHGETPARLQGCIPGAEVPLGGLLSASRAATNNFPPSLFFRIFHESQENRHPSYKIWISCNEKGRLSGAFYTAIANWKLKLEKSQMCASCSRCLGPWC